MYSPATLPLLRLAASLPTWLSGGFYLFLYVVGIVAQIAVTITATSTHERRCFLYVAPVSLTFPGLLANGILMGGNVAFILYGATLLFTLLGLKKGNWHWFYLSVLAASCFKAPMLSLLAIPVLSSRRQWLATALTAGLGVLCFAIQPLVWPNLFHHYLQAIDLQIRFNHDFGCSPAGLFSGFLYDRGIPYSPGGALFYLCYAVPLFTLLLRLRHMFLSGRFNWQEWMPVMLVGVILLNPRIIEYDLTPITIPLALIAWRFFTSFMNPARRILTVSLAFVITNSIAISSQSLWKLVEGPLLVFLFLAGCWNLTRPQPQRCHSTADFPG